MPTQRVYLYPWELLRRAWLHYRDEWKAEYKIVLAQNNGYTTHSVAVPIAVVGNAVKTAMVIQLQEAPHA